MSWTYEHTFNPPGTPVSVYRAWTDPTELTRWFAERAEVKVTPGGDFRFWGRHTLGCPTDAQARQQITRLEALFGVPVVLISTGPRREETIVRRIAPPARWVPQPL